MLLRAALSHRKLCMVSEHQRLGMDQVEATDLGRYHVAMEENGHVYKTQLL